MLRNRITVTSVVGLEDPLRNRQTQSHLCHKNTLVMGNLPKTFKTYFCSSMLKAY